MKAIFLAHPLLLQHEPFALVAEHLRFKLGHRQLGGGRGVLLQPDQLEGLLLEGDGVVEDGEAAIEGEEGVVGLRDLGHEMGD